MSNTTLILLIIAGVIALIVLQMTSSKPSEQVSDKESKPVKDSKESKVETPKDSSSSVKERFSYSENMTDSAQEYNMENYTQDSEQEQEQEQDSEQEQDQEHFDQEQELDQEHFDQDQESEQEQPQDSEQDQDQEQEQEQPQDSEQEQEQDQDSEQDQELEGFSQNLVTGSYQPTGSNVPKAEFVIKSALQGNNFGGGKFNVKLTGKEAQVGPNTTNVNALSLGDKDMDFTLGVTPVVSKEKRAKKLTAKDLLPVESKDDWFDMPYDKKQMMRIENENLLAGSSTQARIGIDTQGQTLKNASHDLRAAPPNPKFNIGPWNNSTIEPDLMRVPLELGSGAQ